MCGGVCLKGTLASGPSLLVWLPLRSVLNAFDLLIWSVITVAVRKILLFYCKSKFLMFNFCPLFAISHVWGKSIQPSISLLEHRDMIV